MLWWRNAELASCEFSGKVGHVVYKIVNPECLRIHVGYVFFLTVKPTRCTNFSNLFLE
jgi:hypothetical protein